MIVITGGSRGIGYALVHKFASEGFDIATCARNLEALLALKKEVQTQYGTNIYIQSADLSVKEDVSVFIDFLKRINKPIEVLINNAGNFTPGSVHQEPDGLLEQMIATNLYSAYYLTRGLLDEMIARKSGHIFNMASIASFQAHAEGASYAIAKHALWGFSKSLREELKPHHIKVTSILPGATLTSNWGAVEIPEERFCKPSDIADMIYATHQLSANTVVEDMVLRPQLGDF